MTGLPNILIIEDDEDDYCLACDLLTEAYGQDLNPDWEATWEGGMDALHAESHDVYLIDYRLGARDGLDLIKEANEHGCQAPIIVLTGQDSHDIDLRAMEVGATNYLVKSRITADQLARAIRYGINRKSTERRLAGCVQYDVLTGLANRSLFSTSLKSAIAQSKRSKRLVAVLLLDLDRFKDVNDTMGYSIGDKLLQGVSERLLGCVRETDTVARLSGDEFAVIATNLKSEKGAATVADKIIDALAETFEFEGTILYAGVSIGISLITSDVDDPSEYLKNADVALYQAKAESGCAYCFFDEAMNAREQAFRSMKIDIRAALEQGQFELHYQPKIRVDNGAVSGVEALLRWSHPERGMVAPDKVIPVAEASGLIMPLGAWVLNEACAQIGAWQKLGLPAIPVAVNTSALQFKQADFFDTVARTISTSGIAPDMLELEITESVIMDQSKGTNVQIQNLHDLGVRISIDDFGTVYSSLGLLAKTPVHGLKVDRSFVEKLTDDAKQAAVVKTIIALAKNLHLSVVAEGVETKSQFDFLREHGCGEIQGWYISPALSADQFVAWYRTTQQRLNATG